MPVIMPPSRWDDWLKADAKSEQLQAMLTPYASDDLVVWPVTPRKNKVAFESPECVAVVEEQWSII